MCCRNHLEEVCPFSVSQCYITFFRDKFPIDKCDTSTFKPHAHGIKKTASISLRCKFIHLIHALLFKITFSRTKPYKSGISVCIFEILIYILNEYNCFTSPRRCLDCNNLLALRIQCLVHQKFNTIILKFMIPFTIILQPPSTRNRNNNPE